MRVDISDLVELDKRLERAALRISHVPLVTILSSILIIGLHLVGAFMVALLLLSVSMAAPFLPLRYAGRWAAWILNAREILICLAAMLTMTFSIAINEMHEPHRPEPKLAPLTDAQVQMARELGMNPKMLGELDNHKQEPQPEKNDAYEYDYVVALGLLFLGLPDSLLTLAVFRRPLRYARRWATWILTISSVLGILYGLALLGFALAAVLAPAAELNRLDRLWVVLSIGCALAGSAGLAWPVAVGIVAAHQVHRLRFEGMAIDSLRCIRFRTQGPPGTWSPRKLVMVGLLLGSPVLLFLLIISALIQFQPGAWSALLLILPAALAYWSWPMARRLKQASVAEARRRDPRPPVLLLRSFHDDVLPLGSPAPRRGSDRPTTFEEVLTGQLWRRGPVIAIGRPGERIPPMGAARDYYSDAIWQTEAERMVRESQAIVMIVGITPGLGWEMRRVNDLEMLKKLALAFPPVSTDESPRRWTGFLAQITGLSVATPLRDVPAEQVLFIVFPSAEEPVSFITRRQRDPRAYLLALAAASQLIPERSIARKDM